MAQPGEGMAEGLQHRRSAVAVLNIGAMDDQTDQQTQRISDDMALAPLGLLADVKAPDHNHAEWFQSRAS